MRVFACIYLLLAAATAQADAAIAWSPNRLLTWEDFTGRVPLTADAKRVAATTASLAWSYEYSLETSRSTCVFRIDRIESAAEFHPESSWVRPEHRTAAVLRHEQGHFDIAQRYKTIFDQATRDLVGRDQPCRAGSERRAARDAQGKIEELVGTMYDDVWRRYRAEQDAYDSETQHGIDTDAQAAWSDRLESLRTAPSPD